MNAVKLGEAALSVKRLDEAEQHFQAVQRAGNEWLMTRAGRNRLNESTSYARLGLVKVLAARGQYDQAFRLLTREGFPGGLPDSFRKEVRELQADLAKRRR